MTDKLVVFVTFENEEQAQKAAETVVNEHLAACVNLVAAARSCYVWEGKLTWSTEVLAMIKTTQARFGQLAKRIQELHSYEVPEIVSVVIEDASEKYLQWIDRSVGV
jgi:periplasmic divalent cation tolerance protein